MVIYVHSICAITSKKCRTGCFSLIALLPSWVQTHARVCISLMVLWFGLRTYLIDSSILKTAVPRTFSFKHIRNFFIQLFLNTSDIQALIVKIPK